MQLSKQIKLQDEEQYNEPTYSSTQLAVNRTSSDMVQWELLKLLKEMKEDKSINKKRKKQNLD